MTAEEAMGIFDRHGLTGRVPHLDVLVAEALKRVEAERDTVNDALIEALDHAIFYGRDRDQCARERDAYKAERDAARDALWDVVNASRTVERGTLHDLPGALAAAEALLAGDAARVNARAEHWAGVEAERDAACALLAEVRSAVGAAVHELEVGEASDLLDGTIRTPRRQAEEYKRAAADLTWVRVGLRRLLGELAAYDTTTGEAHP